MLSKALDEIRSELCPPGLDPQVFESLRARLLSAVESGRTASEPPDPSFNIIDDLEITDLGGGTFELSWSYRNRGVIFIFPPSANYGCRFSERDRYSEEKHGLWGKRAK